MVFFGISYLLPRPLHTLRKVHGFSLTSQWKYVTTDTSKIVNSPSYFNSSIFFFLDIFKSAMLTFHCTAVLTI